MRLLTLSTCRPYERFWMSSPDTEASFRMWAALQRAARIFDVTTGGEPVSGWRGRTIGSAVSHAGRMAWLRVAECRTADMGNDIWHGTRSAALDIPADVPRPRLINTHWIEDVTGYTYLAELTSYVESPPCSPTAVLTDAPRLDDSWWRSLARSLTQISRVDTPREVIRQGYLDRALPKFLDAPGIDTVPPAGWRAAHGDCHWANLTAEGPVLLDWEGWGLAPAGYDAALLAVHSMLVPEVEAQVRRELAAQLAGPAGRFAELVVLAELLQTTTRGDNLELEPALRRRAAQLLDGVPA